MPRKKSLKTSQKLMLVGSIILVMGLAGGGLYYARMVRNQANIEAQRPAGLAALERGEYKDARDKLVIYDRHFPDDPEVLYALSQATRNLRADDGSHLMQTISVLRRLREAEPDHPTVTEELLELYRRVGFGSELLTLTDEILEEDPDHRDALTARIEALTRMRRFDEAVEAANAMTENYPKEIEPHLVVMQIMRQREAGGSSIISYAQQLDPEQLGESRHAFLVGAAHRFADERAAALPYFKTAAEDPPADATMLSTLTAELDRLGESALATEAVNTAMGSGEVSVELRALHVDRLLQQGAYREAKDALAEVDATSEEADSRLLVYKALTLAELGEPERIELIIENLAARGDDAVAQAWTAVLELGKDPLSPEDQAQELVERLERARDLQPDDAFLALLEGRSYATLGEHELALQSLRDAAQRATASPVALTQMADVYNKQGRPTEAVGAAREALVRAPRHVEAAVQMVLALAELEQRPDDEVMLRLVNNVQALRPGEPRTLPLQVQLLVDNGREDQARQVLEAVAGAERAPSEELLLQLANVARPFAPELAEQLQERSHATHGLTPRLAFMQAAIRGQEHDPAAGLALFDEAEPEEGTPRHQQWQYYRAHYLEATENEQAADAWKALFESGVEDRNMLQAIIQARSVREDRTFLHSVINRLQEVTGEEATLWRMARARWWLSDTEEPEKSAGEAALLLNQVTRIAPDNAEAHWLLANSLGRLGNDRGMSENLRTTLQLEPDRVDAALALVAVLQDRGAFNEAEPFLTRLTDRSLTPVQRRRAAMLWVARGNVDRAIALLQDPGDEENVAADDDLLLANLYLQREQVEQSDEILRELLNDPERANQPQTLRFAADFYAWQGDQERAREMLDRLQQAEGVSDVARHLTLARHFATYGTVEETRQHFQAAVEAEPANAAAWRTYLLWLIQRGEAEQALEVADEAAAQVEGDAGINALTSVDRLEVAIDAPLLRPLAASLLSQPQERADVARALLSDAIAIQLGESDGETFITELQRQAESNPRYLELQNFAARIFIAMDQSELAVRVATRTIEAFPNESEPIELAARALASAGRYEEAISFARRWREQSRGQRVAADVLIARAHLNLDQPQRAIDQLEPDLQQAIANPQRHADLIATYAQALVTLERYDTAGQLLEPLVEDSPQLRSVMRSLAERQVSQPAVAEAWLSRLDEVISEDAIGERVYNAVAWHQAGTRLEQPSFHETCQRIVDELVQLSDPPAAVYMLYGELAQRREDWSAAERGYRLMLEHRPENAAAKNNLAMVLLEQDKQLLQAVELAREAVEALPEVPEVHDTLARVLLKVGQYDEAVTASRRALELQPEGTQWRIELIWTLARAGETNEAVELFEQFQDEVPDLSSLPESSRKRVQEIEQMLASAADASADR